MPRVSKEQLAIGFLPAFFWKSLSSALILLRLGFLFSLLLFDVLRILTKMTKPPNSLFAILIALQGFSGH